MWYTGFLYGECVELRMTREATRRTSRGTVCGSLAVPFEVSEGVAERVEAASSLRFSRAFFTGGIYDDLGGGGVVASRITGS